MKYHIQRKLGSGRPLLMVCGGMLLGIGLCGLPDWALASNRQIPLHVDSGRLTGQLNQVTLRTVLGQLHDQLGLDYVAPDAELEKVITVSFQKELLPRALSMILAQWNYAFTLDAAGNITTLHVMAKVQPDVPSPDTMVNNQGRESQEQNGRTLPRQGGAHHGTGRTREHQLSKNVPLAPMPAGERTRKSRKVFTSLDLSMDIRPPAPGTSMPILPANPKGMQVTPAGSAQSMEIIPASAYPPMNIQPVPEYRQQEMLLPLSP